MRVNRNHMSRLIARLTTDRGARAFGHFRLPQFRWGVERLRCAMRQHKEVLGSKLLLYGNPSLRVACGSCFCAAHLHGLPYVRADAGIFRHELLWATPSFLSSLRFFAVPGLSTSLGDKAGGFGARQFQLSKRATASKSGQ